MSKRLKKFFAAKAAGTKFGRNQMEAHLGEFEERLLNAFCEFVEHMDGKDMAEKLKKYLFKLAAKIGVFVDGGDISPQQLDVLAPALQTIATEITKKEIDVVAVMGALGEVKTALRSMLEPLVTGKSCERLDEIYAYVASAQRISALSFGTEQTQKAIEVKQVLVSVLSGLKVKPNFASQYVETKKARARSKQLDDQIEADMYREALNFKVLLLGAGESGKSTVMSQLRNIHKVKEALSPDEVAFYVDVLHNNTIESMHCILEHFITMNEEVLDAIDVDVTPADMECSLQDETSRDYACRIMCLKKINHTLSQEEADMIYHLSQDAEIQSAIRHQTFYIPDSAEYYFANVRRFVSADFSPSDEDVTMARIRTTGVRTAKLEIPPVQYSFVDVGGQRTERKKWINFFDNVSAIFFVVNLSGYNKITFEDKTQNRMHESLELFAKTASLEVFENTPIFLFLNKKDLFRGMIEHKNIDGCFPDYKGPADYESCIEHIQQAFSDAMPAGREVRHHFVVAACYKADVKNAFMEAIKMLKHDNQDVIREAVKKLEAVEA
ncbi:MAG: hypothetical protein MHM6MM_001975 [Cercozoa sp. M6MM]